MTRNRIAVVTGSNKGIGLEIVRSLCRHLGQDGVVYLTARDEGRGQAAVALLQKEGLSPMFYILDVTAQSTIDRFRDHVMETHGGIDILINNAGLGTPVTMHPYERARRSMAVNFTGLLATSRALIPLVRSHGRIVNMASSTANMVFRELGEDIKKRFRQASTEEDVETLVNEFMLASKVGTTAECGWVDWGYGVSKLAVVALSRIQAANIRNDATRHDILLNSCCPGFILTDLTADFPPDHYGGERVTTVEGADTPVYLALLPPDAKQPHGQFLLRRTVYDFINNDMHIQI